MSVPNSTLRWSTGNYKISDGMVYVGLEPATKADFDALAAYVGDRDYEIDERSLRGRFHPLWSTAYYEIYPDDPLKPGGRGSHTYETQLLGANGGGDIEFRPEDQQAIFHYNPEGEYVHGEIDYPNTGRGFHKDASGAHRAGPRPGSEAQEILGDGSYVWNKQLELWEVE